MTPEIAPIWIYWGTALAVASGVYGLILLFDKNHISDELKEDLTLWLWGEYESTWSEQFGRLFDTVFGTEHLSWKCFFRSSIASALSVLLLYVLFDGVLGVFGSRTERDITMAQVLMFGIALNLIPDYLSLFETRWLLKRFEKIQSFFGQLGVLIVDAIFTGVIILVAINVFQFATGSAPLSMIETLAFFSVFSIFFFSTFLTSIWAWLYCISTWVMKLFARTQLKNTLNVEQNPVAQIALVSFIFLFITTAVAMPLFDKAEGSELTVVDRFFCQTFPSDTVDHCVRLTNDELAALSYLDNACTAGLPEYCLTLVSDYYNGDETKVVTLFQRACDGGSAFGCVSLGYIYGKGKGVAVDFSKAVALYERGCAGGDAVGCSNLGFMYEMGKGVSLDTAEAALRYEQSCDAGHSSGCMRLGFMYETGNGVAIDLTAAAAFYEQGCQAGHARGCGSLGFMYRWGKGVAVDLPKALALYERGCEGGHARACTDLGFIHWQGKGVPMNAAMAVSLYAQACEGDDAKGCSNLGFMYQMGKGVPLDFSKAAEHFEKACNLGRESDC